MRHKRVRCGVAVLALGLAVGVPGVSPAQTGGTLENVVERLERLERTVTTLERAVYTDTEVTPPATGDALAGDDADTAGGDIPETAAVQLQDQINGLQRQMRRMTGKLEETGFKLRKLTKRVKRLEQDVDFRLRRLEQGRARALSSLGGIQAPAIEAAPARQRLNEDSRQTVAEAESGGRGDASADGDASPDPDKVLPGGSPEARYEHAFKLLQKAEYDKAERALAAFVKAHPDHALASNAQYWLGETHYVRENYEQAAAAFAKGYKTYPKGQKAPANLLKLGITLGALERTEDACGIFDELLSQFPDAPANLRERAQLERQNLSCPGA